MGYERYGLVWEELRGVRDTGSGALGETWSKKVTTGWKEVWFSEQTVWEGRQVRGRGMVDRFSFRKVVFQVPLETCSYISSLEKRWMNRPRVWEIWARNTLFYVTISSEPGRSCLRSKPNPGPRGRGRFPESFSLGENRFSRSRSRRSESRSKCATGRVWAESHASHQDRWWRQGGMPQGWPATGKILS